MREDLLRITKSLSVVLLMPTPHTQEHDTSDIFRTGGTQGFFRPFGKTLDEFVMGAKYRGESSKP
jgi:hypothetical protein